MGNEKYHFQKLTPVSDAKIDVYEEAIEFAFDNADVKNVAISGAYSAGKSSVLESYKCKHTNYRFVHLSLAHFRTPEQENDESVETVKESILEGKILNQLIHQIQAEKIPQTNFRVKKGVNPNQIAFLTLFSSLFYWKYSIFTFIFKNNFFCYGIARHLGKKHIISIIQPICNYSCGYYLCCLLRGGYIFLNKSTEKQECISEN